MKIYPAIDIINGKCVRLLKGDFNQTTEYNLTPLEAALEYERQGAEYLHVVDLDGAKNESMSQAQIVEEIIRKTELKIQFGGGIRKMEQVDALLQAGVDRVIIGSLSIVDPRLTEEILSQWGSQVVLALDVNEKLDVLIKGWVEGSDKILFNVIDQYLSFGLGAILVTDISRDGMLVGCNVDLYKRLKDIYPQLEVIASGGVSGLPEITELQASQVDSVIVGKALYENKFSLQELVELVKQ